MSKNNYSKVRPRSHRLVRILVALAVLAAVGAGAWYGYTRLKRTWREQSVLTDLDRQVEIVTGKMVKRGQILESFGLKVGANLADLDFATCRERTLRTIPTVRELSIVRHLPDGITINIVEREPLVRINAKGRREADALGRVTDSEGVVFRCFRGTESLPTLREQTYPNTPPGGRLTGRSFAALKLLESSLDAEFQSLGVIEADATHPDFILLTLGDYSRAKVAWENMADGAGGDRADMLLRLRHLLQAIRTRLATGTVIWNATEPGRIYADTKESFL